MHKIDKTIKYAYQQYIHLLLRPIVAKLFKFKGKIGKPRRVFEKKEYKLDMFIVTEISTEDLSKKFSMSFTRSINILKIAALVRDNDRYNI